MMGRIKDGKNGKQGDASVWQPTWLLQAGSGAGLGFRLKVNTNQVRTGTTMYRLQLVDLLKEGLLDF
ncbi:hypothetical protein CROQUDRAFT_90444 [Cronartium quercuum f. sp. fusiforme G11]|uniref:Uncharacterized protein n=1 Tax=Cronartium quercuum f. sp. fusiforme G11 TaxID=708437 RepID=A0A9P6NMJ9_9BASI|nr:hypothetical protein CROQUDRAFT_90444 [Cronartium quercuum f. sp. fusiforme G11]